MTSPIAPRRLPYGSWPSPLSVDRVMAAGRSLLAPWLDGDALYVCESRPDEGGRVVIVQVLPDGSVRDVTPPGPNVRSRVHEYGGGAYTVRDGRVVFANFADCRLWQQATPDAPAEPLTARETERFADLVIDAARGRVLAVLEDHGTSDHEPRNALAAIALADGTVTTLAEGHDFYSDPRPDPSGTRLCWLTWDRPQMPWDGCTLWVATIAPDGTLADPVAIAGGPEESIANPTWAPDGTLLFATDRSGWWNLHRWQPGVPGTLPLAPVAGEIGSAAWVFGLRQVGVDAHGTVVAVVREDGRDRLAVVDADAIRYVPLDAGITEISGLLVADGAAIAVAGGPARATALVRIRIADGRVTELYTPVPLPVPQDALSVPRHVSFPSAGGRTAYAWYYPPAGMGITGPDGERPPLVVLSHGGPTSDAMTAFSPMIQAFTTRGIAVVDVNYGGSTGYGRPYRDLLRGAWGVVDLEDCSAAATWLAAEGLADPERLAIRGGSAGGYTTLCALAFGDVFRAGVSLYGVGDLAALAQDTHKFESRYLDLLVGPWPEAEALYRARSPIHHVDRIACPVLVLQGADDRVVPPAQSETIVAALAARGLPHAYLLFPGEGHGFRRVENRRRALEAELSFYAQVFGFALADPVPTLALVRPAAGG
ncbi:MAG: prolyl oligopeptidase family serine peptidase [Chloroflexota bacterium]